MSYSIKLINDDNADEAFDWARENCQDFEGVWTSGDEFFDQDVVNEFCFISEQQAILFGLKFGSH